MINSDLIKKLQYADAWNENDICSLLATYNPEIGDYSFFRNLLATAKTSKALIMLNGHEITCHALSRPPTGPAPIPLYIKAEAQKWISQKNLKLPDKLSEQTNKAVYQLQHKLSQYKKLCNAMAQDKYGYDPKSSRNKATGEGRESIQASLLKIGIEMDSETIKMLIDDTGVEVGEIY